MCALTLRHTKPGQRLTAGAEAAGRRDGDGGGGQVGQVVYDARRVEDAAEAEAEHQGERCNVDWPPRKPRLPRPSQRTRPDVSAMATHSPESCSASLPSTRSPQSFSGVPCPRPSLFPLGPSALFPHPLQTASTRVPAQSPPHIQIHI
eukprot:1303345-Rhodomonas_salina.2